ncbi:MAG TPA: EamA family transporter, partial [Candidatus Limnocylindria bacterium]|nr:EamA family transporter [Candidatus Limnocylindria bacterium]
LLAQFGAGLTTSARLLISGLLLLALHRPRFFGWDRDTWKSVLLFGFAMAGMNGFFYAAIARIPLGIAVTIEFAGPLLLSAALSRRRRDLGCVLAAATAIAVLGFGDHGGGGDRLDAVGVGYALIAAAFWAFYIAAGKRVTSGMSGQGSLAIGILVGAFVVAPFGVGSVGDLASAAPAVLLPLVGMALLSSLIPYSLEFVAIRRLSPHVFGVLLCLEPVVACAAGWLLLDQALSWVHGFAMLVVVVSAITVTLSQPAAPAAPPQPVGQVPAASRNTCADGASTGSP